MSQESLWLVKVAFKRVQTYLFDVPRLPVMVGANALLGEVLRGLWLKDGFSHDVPSLPRLAQDNGADWPNGVSIGIRGGLTGESDPLKHEGVWQDDIDAVAAKGILARDGGHFEAIFPAGDPGKEKARKFIHQAEQLIQRQLPGVLVDFALHEVKWNDKTFEEQTSDHCEREGSRGTSILEIPQAQLCKFSGNEPASDVVNENRHDPTSEKYAVSQTVKARLDKAKAFDEGEARDVLGILMPEILDKLGFGRHESWAFPADFSALSTSGYIAVIHVDGNRMARRIDAHLRSRKESGVKDFFQQWALREQFFHTARVGLRTAVTEAVIQSVENVFGDRDQLRKKKKMPFRLLMLGGDDLVLVCEAALAMPFLIDLVHGIERSTKDMSDGRGPLTVGAGVAIVRHSFPFYRAYELADQLAASAKRLKASLPADAVPRESNVVDWIVSAESWYGDVKDTRLTESVIDGTLILSEKPYRILDAANGDPTRPSLEKMWKDAKELVDGTKQDRVGRNQLHGLARSLRRGRYTAQFAADILPAKLQDILLRDNKYLTRKHGPWAPLTKDTERVKTRILDLLELYELQMLRHMPRRSRRGPKPSKTSS